ncbi:hypothetical protein BH11MYX1_BH11MYX1_57130 [soil metagenome]
MVGLVGTHFFEAFPNDPDEPNNESRRLLEASFERVMATGQADTIAYIPYSVRESPDGPLVKRIWSATHTPIKNERDEVTQVLQHTEDITQLPSAVTANTVINNAARVQETAKGLSERLRELRALLEQAPGFMAFVTGPEHVFELTNPAFDTVVGTRKLVGLAVRQALPDLADQGFYELLDTVYKSGEPFVGRGLRVNFSVDNVAFFRYVDFVYQPIVDTSGATIGILVQGNDVTEQHRGAIRQQFLTRATEQLAFAVEDLEGALASITQAAVETMADFAVLDLYDGEVSRRIASRAASPANAETAEKLMAFPSPAQLPESHVLHRSQQGIPVIASRITAAEIASSARSPEHQALLATLSFRSVITLPLWHRGRLFGFFLMMTAESGRDFDDSDLSAMSELGRVVSTARDNARLSREREAASRAKDDFLAMLGHELRNPLAPILSAVQLMAMRGGDTKSHRELAIIERQAQPLVRIVDDLLDVSRIVHNKIELRIEDVELSAVITKAVEIATPQIKAKGHTLEGELAPNRELRGDEARLTQVVANLLTNSARYTPRGGQLSVRATREGNAGNEGTDLVVRVRDNGVGIAPEIMPTIFDIFVQAPQSVDRTTGGLGIGLALVRRFVELHGGTVSAHSAGPNQDTEFTVRLPSSPVAACGRRVLFVDDNLDAAELLGELISRRGHVITIVHDGERALAEILANPPEIALIDLGLPGLDGISLATKVTAELGERAPRMIAITGYGGPEDRERGKTAGFFGYLTKPIDVAALLDLIAAP